MDWFTASRSLRTWWNWQTRYFEVVVPQGVQVQVLPCAPFLKLSEGQDRRALDLSSELFPVKNVAILLATLLFLGGCACGPPSEVKIEGRYRVRLEGSFSHEDITLRNGYFTWRYVTAVGPDPAALTGVYSFDGRLLVFHHPLMREPQRVMTRHKGSYLMWTLAQYDEFLKTGQTPLDVLYQIR